MQDGIIITDFDWQKYCRACVKFRVYPAESAYYLALGAISEIGEIADKRKKSVRDGTIVTVDAYAKEIGDVFWYIGGMWLDYNGGSIGRQVDLYHALQKGQYEASGQARNAWLDALVIQTSHLVTGVSDARRMMVFENIKNSISLNHRIAKAVASAYFLSAVIIDDEISLKKVLESNLDKLSKRVATGTIHGSGDDREKQ